jgi:hypothetical protein
MAIIGIYTFANQTRKLIKTASRVARSARYLLFKLCGNCLYQKKFLKTLSKHQAIAFARIAEFVLFYKLWMLNY